MTDTPKKFSYDWYYHASYRTSGSKFISIGGRLQFEFPEAVDPTDLDKVCREMFLRKIAKKHFIPLFLESHAMKSEEADEFEYRLKKITESYDKDDDLFCDCNDCLI